MPSRTQDVACGFSLLFPLCCSQALQLQWAFCSGLKKILRAPLVVLGALLVVSETRACLRVSFHPGQVCRGCVIVFVFNRRQVSWCMSRVGPDVISRR